MSPIFITILLDHGAGSVTWTSLTVGAAILFSVVIIWLLKQDFSPTLKDSADNNDSA